MSWCFVQKLMSEMRAKIWLSIQINGSRKKHRTAVIVKFFLEEKSNRLLSQLHKHKWSTLLIHRHIHTCTHTHTHTYTHTHTPRYSLTGLHILRHILSMQHTTQNFYYNIYYATMHFNNIDNHLFHMVLPPTSQLMQGKYIKKYWKGEGDTTI